jgi:hypothetical protein
VLVLIRNLLLLAATIRLFFPPQTQDDQSPTFKSPSKLIKRILKKTNLNQ